MFCCPDSSVSFTCWFLCIFHFPKPSVPMLSLLCLPQTQISFSFLGAFRMSARPCTKLLLELPFSLAFAHILFFLPLLELPWFFLTESVLPRLNDIIPIPFRFLLNLPTRPRHIMFHYHFKQCPLALSMTRAALPSCQSLVLPLSFPLLQKQSSLLSLAKLTCLSTTPMVFFSVFVSLVT